MAQTTPPGMHPREPTAPPAGQPEGPGAPQAGQAPPREPTEVERAMQAAADEQRIRLEAEVKAAALAVPGTTPVGALTGEQAAKAADEGTVKMTVPKGFTLARADMSTIYFPQGIQEVPQSIKDHPYLKAQGVRPI